MLSVEKIKFGTYLAIISVIGFLGILITSLTDVDVGGWADALLFLIIGGALMIAGGIKFFIKYFENGLTRSEINRIVTIVVGASAFIVGILTVPFFNIEYPVIDGIKAIIASIAIITIIVEAMAK